MKQPLQFLVTALFVWTCGIAHGAEPVVSNVRAAQRAGTKLVDVYYDLSGAVGPATVAVDVSSDGGSSYAVPATTFTGDVGSGVANGSNKHAIWNAAADWDAQFSLAVKFRITASTVPLDGFVLIPSGSFSMGNSANGAGGRSDELPVHTVSVSAFYMAKYKVTKALWDEVRTWAAANGYTDLPTGAGKAADHPVGRISWYDMVKWCNARSQKDGLTACYTVSGAIYKLGNSNTDAVACNWSASGYRLPTEAEWEKAARGGLSGQRFPWGNTINWSLANYYANPAGDLYDTNAAKGYNPSFTSGDSPYTSPVWSFAANGYGLHDMAGNVSEGCWDRYDSTYYASSPGSDPRGSSSGYSRVLRGGSWGHSARGCRVAIRLPFYYPVDRDDYLGFRPARSSVP